MALAQRTVGGKVTAAGENEEVNLLNLMPFVSIVPVTSGTGTSIVTSVNGLTTFTAATVLIFDSCFSSLYRSYRIIMESQGTAASATMVLRTAAPADVTTLYDSTTDLARNSTLSSATTPGGSSWSLSLGSVNVIHQMEMTISKPFEAASSSALLTYGVHSIPAAANTNNNMNAQYLTQQATTSTPGFKITFSAAQSGTVRVIGIL